MADTPMECPYCSCEGLEELLGPDTVNFSPLVKLEHLNSRVWKAYYCNSCSNVVILDGDEMNKLELSKGA